jgi:hypothetical protein
MKPLPYALLAVKPAVATRGTEGEPPELLVWVLVGTIVLLFASVVFFLVQLSNATNKRLAYAAKVRQTGLAAQAQVVSVRTLEDHDSGPKCELTLMIFQGNVPSYQVRIWDFIDFILIPRVQPGLMVPVKIDPSYREGVVLDFER